ncbi:MAG: hypothetical protein R3D71_03390 [Rickettsiales bacterium]
MSETKKPIILVVDDVAKEDHVVNNISCLAGSMGYDAERIKSQVKVITDGKEALNFIGQAKSDNQPIAAAFVDDQMQAGNYGFKLAKAVKESNPDSSVVWISTLSLHEAVASALKENELFKADDKLMFNDNIMFGGMVKHYLLKKDLSPVINNKDNDIGQALKPVFEQAFSRITNKTPSGNVDGVNSSKGKGRSK